MNSVRRQYEEILELVTRAGSVPDAPVEELERILAEEETLLCQLDKHLGSIKPKEASTLVKLVQEILESHASLRSKLLERRDTLKKKEENLGKARVRLNQLRSTLKMAHGPSFMDREI